MQNRKNILLPILIVAMALILASCKKKDDTELRPVDASITIYMQHVVKGIPVEFDNIRYQNLFGNLYSVSRLQYFVSDFLLTMRDGSTIFIDEAFYVDARDDSSLILSPSTRIPIGEYAGVSFIFGLTEQKNLAGRYPNPPENNMEWPLALGFGYHYMKLEGKVDSAGTINNFQAHTGPTFGNQNYIRVSLPGVSFTTSGDQAGFAISMDINQWWESPNTFDLNLMTMVMGNQEVQQQLHDNGMSVFSFEPLISVSE